MKPIRWTHHADSNLVKRGISRDDAEKTINEPDAIMPASPSRSFRQRRYLDKTLSAIMLMRVLVEETTSENVVITLYKTSKFGKYE
jgi:uncharacterized DUF497 family protein